MGLAFLFFSSKRLFSFVINIEVLIVCIITSNQGIFKQGSLELWSCGELTGLVVYDHKEEGIIKAAV